MSQDYKIVPVLPQYTISKEMQATASAEELRKWQDWCVVQTKSALSKLGKAKPSKGTGDTNDQ